MSQAPGLMLPGLLALVCLFGGILGNRWWTHRTAKARRRIPREWPLEPRAMANSQERKVWRWLVRVFFDHHVMIKVPVTRFTLPRSKENSAHWYQLLTGVYCTFTVCGPDGQVVGCVDVPGVNGISRGNMQLKMTLLSQCGIAYCVVKPDSLPTLEEIREEFLGSHAAVPNRRYMEDAAITAARQKLRAAVDRQRTQRVGADSVASTGAASSGFGSSSFLPSEFGTAAWQQPDSFIAPLDSRLAKLR
jgi:Protein of unknown function (DUF2726)